MIRTEEDLIVLTPPERLDTTNSPDAEREIVSKIEEGATRVVIDLSNTSFVSSAGLRVILKVAKLLHQQDGALALCGLSDQITEVFEVSGFMTLVKVVPTFEEAAAAVKSSAS